MPSTDIESLLESFLGESRSGADSNGQVQFNCPCCADKLGHPDGKYNLEVNINRGVFQCWKCAQTDGMSGPLPKLIRRYGDYQVLSEYYSIVKDEAENGMLDFSYEMEDDRKYSSLSLPESYRKITPEDPHAVHARKYMLSRGISDRIMDYYDIGYVGPYSPDWKMRERIIIPSYDSFGDLNYYVARSYNPKVKYKYMNPDVDKKEIIFDEKHICWYGDVTLVEGAFDHIAIPNSIPMLGKILNEGFYLFDALLNKAKANINILLDDDAIETAKKLYCFLDQIPAFNGRVRLIPCPDGYDAALIYQKFGKKGIAHLMRRAVQYDYF